MDDKKLYKCSEWEDLAGRWYVNGTSNIMNGSGAWWIPARILNISLTDFVKLLVDEYHVSHLFYSIKHDVLIFSWDNYKDAHRWLLYINRIAKSKQVMI